MNIKTPEKSYFSYTTRYIMYLIFTYFNYISCITLDEFTIAIIINWKQNFFFSFMKSRNTIVFYTVYLLKF